MHILRSDQTFRRFIIARSLLLSSALTSTISIKGIILILSIIGLGGALASLRLPNVEQEKG